MPHAEIHPDQSVALLKALHILTRDGKLNQDSRRKLKQVYHLFHFVEPLLQQLAKNNPEFMIVDHGAGKSYLGFILVDLYLRRHAPGACVVGIETRPELIERSRILADQSGFAQMQFINVSAADSIQSDLLPARVDMVTALHACNTATDDAIRFGLAKQAQFIVLVPCCQAEVARRLSEHKALSLSRTPLAELWRHPLHTREIGSQITNVLRCLYLEASGYQVTVTELVGWEHSMKNDLIMARYTGQRKRSAAERLRALLHEFGLDAMLETRFRLAGPAIEAD